MPKSGSIETQIAEVAMLAKAENSAETRKQLQKHLSSKTSLIVAKAADVATRLESHELLPDLIAAFHRFMKDPAKSDKGCAAKTAIVKALLAADCDDESVFKTGIRHVQMEPVWGGRADTAAPLRALCGLGLVQTGSRDTLNELASLLADTEPDARIGAASALSHCGASATPLLRFKVLTGDKETAVLAECLNGLIKADPSGSFEFVARFVDPDHPQLSEHAALALGESRMPGVFELLSEKWASTFNREFKRSLLLPMALSRNEAAIDFLISVIESGEVGLATAAISALSVYRGDATLRKRAEEAVSGPKSEQLMAEIRRAFD